MSGGGAEPQWRNLTRIEYLPSALVHVVHHPALAAGKISLAELEWHHIQNVLQQTGGNRRNAARILGISTATLWRKMKLGCRSE